jgi:hypothetical protein
MISIGHSAVGAAIGVATYQFIGDANPLLGLTTAGITGLASHYLTDIVPHGHFFKGTQNYKRNIIPVIIFDVFLGALLFLALSYYRHGLDWQLWYVLFGIGGAQFPDVLDNITHIGVLPRKGLLKTHNIHHENTHWHGKGDNGLLLGIRDIWQLTVVVLVCLYIVVS